MLQYDFMQNAFLAGTAIAIMCGVIGVFVIARGLGLLAHAFSDIGFAGGAFAIYMGWNPLYGLLLFTTVSGIVIGRLGTKVIRRDTSISVVLGIAIGLGVLFLSLSSRLATAMFSLLFGSIVSVSSDQVIQLFCLSGVILFILLVGYRMLTFDSFDPVGAIAANLPTKLISVGFVLVLSFAVADAMQIVGSLLVFTLMTIPAATARLLTRSISRMIILAALFAVAGVWLAITFSYYTNAPVSFYIALIEGVLYFTALGWQNLQVRIGPSTTSVQPSVESGVESLQSR